jgi:hypothetical protein
MIFMKLCHIRFPSVIIVTEERALVHYDLLAISRVLPTVPKIRLSCIFCTWFPLRRSEDRGHSIRWVTFHPVLDKSLWYSNIVIGGVGAERA